MLIVLGSLTNKLMYPDANHALFHRQCNSVPTLCWYIPGALKCGAKPTSSNNKAASNDCNRKGSWSNVS